MCSQQPLVHSTTYFNVMELLVADEVDHQLQAIPYNLAQYLNRSEIETFALNRLPALYAASEQGLAYQRTKAQKQLRQQVSRAVRQAFAAVKSDPLRASQPLQVGSPQSPADTALTLLQEVMQLPHLTWEQALEVLTELKPPPTQGNDDQAAPDDRRKTVPTNSPVALASAISYGQHASELNSTALRPGIYGCRTAWIPGQYQAEKRHRDLPSTTST